MRNMSTKTRTVNDSYALVLVEDVASLSSDAEERVQGNAEVFDHEAISPIIDCRALAEFHADDERRTAFVLKLNLEKVVSEISHP